MTIEVQKGSLEEKIIRLLMKRYPISIKEVAKELRLPIDKAERIIKGFASRGIVSLDVLPDTNYVRLVRRDFHFVGRNPSQQKKLKHKKDKRHKQRVLKKIDDYDGMMYQ